MTKHAKDLQDQGYAIFSICPSVNLLEVGADRWYADLKLGGDFVVAQSAKDQLDDSSLLGRECE